MRISYWSSDVGSSDLDRRRRYRRAGVIGLEPAQVHHQLVVAVDAAALAGDRADPARVFQRAQHGVLQHLRRRLGPVGALVDLDLARRRPDRSEEHTSELQSLMRISYAVFCLKKKKNKYQYE